MQVTNTVFCLERKDDSCPVDRERLHTGSPEVENSAWVEQWMCPKWPAGDGGCGCGSRDWVRARDAIGNTGKACYTRALLGLSEEWGAREQPPFSTGFSKVSNRQCNFIKSKSGQITKQVFILIYPY